VKSADGVHDMLLSLGDLTEPEVRERSLTVDVAASTAALIAAAPVLSVRVAGDPRLNRGRGRARFRDALGVPMRSAFLKRCCSRSAIRWAIWSGRTRARTRRSPPPTSRADTESACRPPKPC